MKLTINILAFGVAAYLAPAAQALTCNTKLTSSVTLTDNLVCQNTWALEVGADNVTINLNGHTISCVSATGFEGSCQNNSGQTATSPIGIYALSAPGNVGHSNVQIHGPGTITGFAQGITMFRSQGSLIDGVTITGPPVLTTGPFLIPRGTTIGIAVFNPQCLHIREQVPALKIKSSEIMNQTNGIALFGASCVVIEGNSIHDNGGSDTPGDSTGISLLSYKATEASQAVPSSDNVIHYNNLVRNGVNADNFDSGILITGHNNTISNNYVSENCGSGIALFEANGNKVTSNFAIQNSTSTFGGECKSVTPGKFFDMALSGISSGPSNTWTNNTCLTASPGVPAGACQ